MNTPDIGLNSIANALANSQFSSKNRIAQSLLITQQMFNIQTLYNYGLTQMIPPAIHSLKLSSTNFHDKTFNDRLSVWRKKISETADSLYPLRPADIRMQSLKYQQHQDFIQMAYAEKTFFELMLLFQRKNIVANKMFKDMEADLVDDENTDSGGQN